MLPPKRENTQGLHGSQSKKQGLLALLILLVLVPLEQVQAQEFQVYGLKGIRLDFLDGEKESVSGILYSANDSLIYLTDTKTRWDYYQGDLEVSSYRIDHLSHIKLRRVHSPIEYSVIGLGLGVSLFENRPVGLFSGAIMGLVLGLMNQNFSEKVLLTDRRRVSNVLKRKALIPGEQVANRLIFKRRDFRLGLRENIPIRPLDSVYFREYYSRDNDDNYSFQSAAPISYGFSVLFPLRQLNFLELGFASGGGVKEGFADWLFLTRERPIQLVLDIGMMYSQFSDGHFGSFSNKLGIGIQYNFGRFHTMVKPVYTTRSYSSRGGNSGDFGQTTWRDLVVFELELGAYYDFNLE